MNPFSRLSPRDQSILSTIDQFNLVTTSQVMRLHFDDPGSSLRSRQVRACRVLARLADHRFLKRTGRTIGGGNPGSSEYVYLPPSSSAGSAPYHTIAITELFTVLTLAHRSGQIELLNFEAELDGYRQYGNTVVRPDARIRVRTESGTYPWFIEIDRGNRQSAEFRKQLRAKLNTYISAQAQRKSKLFPRVLFLVLDADRLDFIQSVIASSSMPTLFQIRLFDDAVSHLNQ